MSTAEPIVRFVGIGKTYDGVLRVVEALDLDVERGEFLTLLGPSGSGKTTTLMLLAGFETPTAGEILLEGKPLSRVPPYQRNIGMVFQNYALFPHMTIAENIAFPCRCAVCQRATSRRASNARSVWCSSAASEKGGRHNSPAASSNASRWLARWCSSRS